MNGWRGTGARAAGLILALGLAAPADAQGLGGGLRRGGGLFGRGDRDRATAPAEAPIPGGVSTRLGTLPGGATAPPAPVDPNVRRTNTEVPPEPIPLDQVGKPSIPLPSLDQLEPYLLRKEHGPFMIMAHTFRGPEATQYALALAMELQGEYKLPAYVFHLKIQPGGSNIRNVQPTAEAEVPNAEVGSPEKFRVFDEAAVLVGNFKSVDEAEPFLHRVKSIKSRTVEALPTIWAHRKGQGLKRAHITANPLQAAQNLYPGTGSPAGPAATGTAPLPPPRQGQSFDPYAATAAFEQARKADPLVHRMNGGPHSIYRCPGPYTFQVAEFTGRTSADPSNPQFNDTKFFERSPLRSAHDDAETVAAMFEKSTVLDDSFRPYVYHDRTRSIVTLGNFSGPNDPRLAALRAQMPKVLGDLLQKQSGQMLMTWELIEVPRD